MKKNAIVTFIDGRSYSMLVNVVFEEEIVRASLADLM